MSRAQSGVAKMSYHSPEIQDGGSKTGNAWKMAFVTHWNETLSIITNLIKYGDMVTVSRLHGDTIIRKSKMATIQTRSTRILPSRRDRNVISNANSMFLGTENTMAADTKEMRLLPPNVTDIHLGPTGLQLCYVIF